MEKQNYNQSSAQFFLQEKEVHIWQIDTNCISNESRTNLEKLLSSDESVRARKFRFDKDRDAFIKGTGFLRLLIQSYTEIPAEKVSFTLNDFGKPDITKEQNSKKIYFNLSNSQNQLCIGFILNEPIGVDIEVIKHINDYYDVANNFFSDLEIAQLKNISEENSLEAFYSCWTGKEAFIKFSGEGLSYPLKQFDVKIKVLDIDEVFQYTLTAKNTNENFFVESFKLNRESVGAFALKAEPVKTIYKFFDEKDNSINNFIDIALRK